MDTDYCVLCQEPHKMSSSCLQCKECGRKGHVRRDCPVKDLEGDDGKKEDSMSTVGVSAPAEKTGDA